MGYAAMMRSSHSIPAGIRIASASFCPGAILSARGQPQSSDCHQILSRMRSVGDEQIWQQHDPLHLEDDVEVSATFT